MHFVSLVFSLLLHEMSLDLWTTICFRCLLWALTCITIKYKPISLPIIVELSIMISKCPRPGGMGFLSMVEVIFGIVYFLNSWTFFLIIKWSSFNLLIQLTGLAHEDKEALVLLIEAASIMDDIFHLQVGSMDVYACVWAIGCFMLMHFVFSTSECLGIGWTN